jgi:hypothetical protein
MGRRSSIARLPAEIREAIGRLRNDGRTIEEILAKLRELNAEVSRSALGRHVKQLDEIAEQLRNSRAVAEALIARFGEEPDNRVARLNIELMHGIVMKLLVTEDGDAGKLDPQETMFVANALNRLAGAQKLDTDRELQIRREMAKEATKKLDQAVKDAGASGEKGLSADRIAQLRRDFLGVGRGGAPS